MTRYMLTDWEINGHDDSDFMCTYYDDATKEVHAHMYGTTRCAAPTIIGWAGNVSSVLINGEPILYPTAEKVEGARVWLENYLFGCYQRADKRLVDEPSFEHLHEGLEVRLLSDCKFQLHATEPCNKCFGSGKWVNPKNPHDKRDCFGCKGTGQHVTGKLKNEAGKLAFEKLAAGAHGKVVDWRAFGTFYPNGYNKPDRLNTTVQFKLDSGKVVRASLKKLRLHREYLSDTILREQAMGASYSYRFSSIYPRAAWDTHNFAMQVAQGRPSSHANE